MIIFTFVSLCLPISLFLACVVTTDHGDTAGTSDEEKVGPGTKDEGFSFCHFFDKNKSVASCSVAKEKSNKINSGSNLAARHK